MKQTLARNKSLVSHLRRGLGPLAMTLFVLVSGLCTASASADRAQVEQRLFNEGMDFIFNFFIENGGEHILFTRDGKPLPMSELKERSHEIYYAGNRGLFNSQGINCTTNLTAQWITAADSPNHRPVVSGSEMNSMVNYTQDDWRLLFHETISSLGYVDDEYQITGPLFLMVYTAKEAKTSLEQMVKEPKWSVVAAPLKKIEKRMHAPRYKMGESDLCYEWKNGVGHLQGTQYAGNTTGVGGGGDSDSLLFKMQLLRDAHLWWTEHNSKKLGPDQEQKFVQILTELGIEPQSDGRSHFITTFPLQLEFRKSKRTQRLTAYLLLERIKKYWGQAEDLICEHTYNYLLPARSAQERDRHAVYGWELKSHYNLPYESDFNPGGKPRPQTPGFPKD